MNAVRDETTVPLTELFSSMALIRAFEDHAGRLYRAGELPGFMHTSIGQEATAVGVCAPLRTDDHVVSTHRGHGHCLAKGADLDGAMAELFGRRTGLCGGKGGSMHMADPRVGVLGANAIVGASMPLAVGAGLSSRMKGLDRLSVAFFGEGAVNTGVFHESLNLAAIWELPVLFVCENNGYAEFSDSSRLTRRKRLEDVGPAYGVEAATVDGNDVEAVFHLISGLAARCRAGGGPFVVEAMTYRWRGHYEGDPQRYKPEGELAEWQARDPLIVARSRLEEQGISVAELDAVLDQARERVERAEQFARSSPFPAVEEAMTDVYG